MKMKFFFLLAIAIFPLHGLAQSNGNAVLVDEFSARITCEDVLARTDAFASRLKESPGKTGAVVVRGFKSPSDLKGSRHVWPTHFIHRALVASTGNEARINILSSQGSEPSVQFWIVPEGASFEQANSQKIGTVPFEVNERVFYAADDPGPCSGQVLRGFVTMLKTYPNLSGYMVNINFPKSERTRTLRYDLDTLRENRLSNRGIRIFFKNIKMRPEDFFGYTEYWLLPGKK